MNEETAISDYAQQLKDISGEIAEINMMIDHSIKLGYREEIAFWRRALQAAKKSKRRLAHL